MLRFMMPSFATQGCQQQCHTKGTDFPQIPDFVNPNFLFENFEKDNGHDNHEEVDNFAGLLDDLMSSLLQNHGYRNCSKEKRESKMWVKLIFLPSIEPEDVKIKVNGKNLIVHASNKEEQNGDFSRYEVQKTVSIPPDVDNSKIKARLFFGHVLKIEAQRLSENEKQTATKLKQSGENNDVNKGVRSANQNESVEPRNADVIIETGTLGEETDTISSSFEHVNTDIGHEDGRGEIGKHIKTKNRTSSMTDVQNTDSEPIYGDILKRDSLSVENIPPSRTSAASITIENAEDVDRNGNMYHEIRLNTHAFDPASVVVRSRDDQLTVCAMKRVDAPDCNIHQEAQQVLKLPNDVDLELIRCFIDESGSLIVSAPYKCKETRITELPIQRGVTE